MLNISLRIFRVIVLCFDSTLLGALFSSVSNVVSPLLSYERLRELNRRGFSYKESFCGTSFLLSDADNNNNDDSVTAIVVVRIVVGGISVVEEVPDLLCFVLLVVEQYWCAIVDFVRSSIEYLLRILLLVDDMIYSLIILQDSTICSCRSRYQAICCC